MRDLEATITRVPCDGPPDFTAGAGYSAARGSTSRDVQPVSGVRRSTVIGMCLASLLVIHFARNEMPDLLLDPVVADPMLEFDAEPRRHCGAVNGLDPRIDPLLEFASEAPIAPPPAHPSSLVRPPRVSMTSRPGVPATSVVSTQGLVARLGHQLAKRLRVTVLCTVTAAFGLVVTSMPNGSETTGVQAPAAPSILPRAVAEAAPPMPVQPAVDTPAPVGRVAPIETRHMPPARPAREDAARTPARIAPPRATARPAPNGFRGSLAVASNPPGARVTLNGSVVGTTPLAIDDLPAGSRVLRLELRDHAAWSSSIQVVADTVTRVHADLQPSRH